MGNQLICQGCGDAQDVFVTDEVMQKLLTAGFGLDTVVSCGECEVVEESGEEDEEEE